jgi:MlaC protein
VVPKRTMRLAAALVVCLLGVVLLATPARAGAPNPETAVKDAYAELSALLYAPPSEARELEIAAIIGRNVDFDELTRRAFGEPCPIARCKDHWVDLSNVERDEVRTLFEGVVTREWTRDLDRAFAYDVDIQKPVVHERDARVRVVARQKGTTDSSLVLDLFFLADKTPYKLVDLDAAKARFAKNHYKQFDRELSNPSLGYQALVARLKKKLEREAGVRDSGNEPKVVDDPDVEPDPETDAASPEVPAPPAPPPPPSSAPAPQLPWGRIALAGVLTLGIGVALGRMRRKDSSAKK